MHRSSSSAFAGVLLWLCMLIAPAAAKGAYCSSQNTAGDFDAQYWEWQSNGWCTDKCNKLGKYAFAVVLTNNCWCSNYIPADQQDVSDCNDNCPGFPSEKCGNKADNLYIYVKLANSPSGTQGSSSPTSSSNVSPTPSAITSSSTEAPSSSEATTSETSSSSSPSSSSPSSTMPSSTSSSEETSTMATTMPPQTTVQIVTQSGQVVTQTVVTTPTSALSQTSSKKSSSSTGAIVGGVVGGIAGMAAVVGGIFILFRRRRQQQQQQQQMQEDGGQSGVQRNVSTMSKAGLLRTGNSPQYPPPIATNFTRRQSRTLDQESISPISGSDRRNSRLQVDQRLNPSAIFMFDNSSAASMASIDDSRDYHRPLNIRNPDPE